MVKFLRPDDTFSQDLSAAALSHSLTLTKPAKLQKITFHISVNITETITITLDSVKGAAYDTILQKVTLVGKQDYVYTPDGENDFQSGDIIKVQCTNANATGTISGIIKMRELN
jgi:hypothetical protein